MLARLLTKFRPTDEGNTLYRKGMDMLIASRPKEVAEAFKEYYDIYLSGVNPKTQLRLASFFINKKIMSGPPAAWSCFRMIRQPRLRSGRKRCFSVPGRWSLSVTLMLPGTTISCLLTPFRLPLL